MPSWLYGDKHTTPANYRVVAWSRDSLTKWLLVCTFIRKSSQMISEQPIWNRRLNSQGGTSLESDPIHSQSSWFCIVATQNNSTQPWKTPSPIWLYTAYTGIRWETHLLLCFYYSPDNLPNLPCGEECNGQRAACGVDS